MPGRGKLSDGAWRTVVALSSGSCARTCTRTTTAAHAGVQTASMLCNDLRCVSWEAFHKVVLEKQRAALGEVLHERSASGSPLRGLAGDKFNAL